jgi:hypothetical protein
MKIIHWLYFPTGKEGFHNVSMDDEMADKYVKFENESKSNWDIYYWTVAIKESIN